MMDMTNNGGRNLRWLRWAGWGGAAALVAAPFVLMQIAPGTGFDWSGIDFLLAAVLIASLGLLAETLVRIAAGWLYRLGAAMAAATGLLLVWSNLAVGYIGDGEALINGVFLAIPAAAMLAAIFIKGRASAMMWIMLAATVAHGAAGMVSYPQDTRTGPISLVFVGLWLGSAALFRIADRTRSHV